MRTENITELSKFNCFEVLETNLDQLEGMLGALECSNNLNERMLKACLFNLSTLAEESRGIVDHLRNLPD